MKLRRSNLDVLLAPHATESLMIALFGRHAKARMTVGPESERLGRLYDKTVCKSRYSSKTEYYLAFCQTAD